MIPFEQDTARNNLPLLRLSCETQRDASELLISLGGSSMVLLAVSYDSSSLNTRKAFLQSAGYMVVPASTLAAALSAIGHYHYDLLVLGATVPENDRQRILNALRRVSPYTSILAVGGVPFGYADGVVEAGDAQKLLAAVRTFKAVVASQS